MGIYLPNMEMPHKGQMLVIFPDGTSYVCFNGMRERLAQTKAVPVPPHGDLIDRDEARGSIKPWSPEDERNGCTFDTVKKLMHTMLDRAPTIIPTEPAEEGE